MAKRRRRKKKNHALLRIVLALVLLVMAMPLLGKLRKQEPLLPQSNPFRAADFAYENGRMVCLSAESVPGIDVSYYQGKIDWEQVRQSGVEFAFIRVGYRSSADGLIYEDKTARQNLQQASAAGVKVGAYFFSQALSVKEAMEEAVFAIKVVKDYKLDLPLVYDWETVSGSNRTDGMTQETLTSCAKTFCSAVEAAGYDSMVYFNRDLSRTLLDVSKLTGIPVWFAMYDSYPDAPCKPDYWQYTDKGTVPGIEGYVDLNLYFP